MDKDLIARYLAGETDATEKEKVQNWIKSDSLNSELMEEYKQIWKASREGADEFRHKFTLDEGLEELRKRMEMEDADHRTKVGQEKYLKLPQTRFAQLLRVAAVLLVGSLIGILFFTSQNEYKESEVVEPVLREISMDKGQRGNLRLSDGTHVILNADSKIILPNTFKPDRREITLKGEAFLDVAHDPDRPFVINVGDAVVEVLGTSFGIRSYPADESVQVVVRDGKVSLASKQESVNNNAVLSAGEMGRLFMSDYSIKKQVVEDMDLFLGWKEGKLKFKDTRMEKVSRELERKYDVEIMFADERLKDLKLTAELKSRTFKKNLDAISISLGIEYKIDQGVCTFYQGAKVGKD